MKNIKSLLLAVLTSFIAISCSNDEYGSDIPLPNDITLNELALERFTYQIPENGFSSGSIHFNTLKKSGNDYSGFCYSNRNNRSFVSTEEDNYVNMFSVYTKYPNRTETYAIAHVADDATFLTIDKPTVVEHILVANTTYAYLAMKYGDVFGTKEKPEKNPNLEAAPKGVWESYVPGGVKKMDEDGDFLKLKIYGYKGGTKVGQVDFFLCTRKADSENPTYDYVMNDWVKVDLVSLGEVDKLSFKMESNDMAIGKMRTPAYFCLDGIRLKK